MWSSFFLAAWRNLGRQRWHGALTIGSLGLALGVVILLGLILRNEWRFDRFLPGMDKTFMVVLATGDGGPTTNRVPIDTADWLRADAPGAIVARMIYGETHVTAVGHEMPVVRFGISNAMVPTDAVDPSFFAAFPLPVVHGDLLAAARAPDTIVIGETLARTSFGSINVIGRQLLITFPGNVVPPITARVGAVLRDPPPESYFHGQVYLVGNLAAQRFAVFSEESAWRRQFDAGVVTYVRLPPGSSPKAVANALTSQLQSRDPQLMAALHGRIPRFELVPVAELHRRTDIPQQTYAVPMGIFLAIAGFAGFVLLMAGGNFILLMIGQGAARSVEIGVRTALGARLRDLVLQLAVEAMLYSLASIIVGMALVEQALPFVDRLIGRSISIEGWRDGTVLLGLFGLLCAIGVGAGLWPALMLAMQHPVHLLRDPLSSQQSYGMRRHGRLRSTLIVAQFAMLTTLLLTSIVFYRQIALEETPRGLDVRNVLIVGQAPQEIDAEIAALPGVIAAGRSSDAALFGGLPNGRMESGGKSADVVFNAVGGAFFSLYGVKPLAGTVATVGPLDRPSDAVVVNQSAANALGFATPAAAIGRHVRFTGQFNAEDYTIVGVVADIGFSGSSAGRPAAYRAGPWPPESLSIRVKPGSEKAVQQAIAALWIRHTNAPLQGAAMEDLSRANTGPTRSLAVLLSAFTFVGGVVAAVGLFQVSAYNASRKAREIALRQAFGARPWETVRVLVKDETPPVLLAIVVAWPAAAMLTAPWLRNFQHHVEIGPVTILIAGICVLGVAWLTTGLHAVWIGRLQPAKVLRYE